jgi:RNA polymerase I-specific transcription initiation factor RRN3
MELFPIMSSNSPFRMRPSAELVWYYRQCLEVVQYLPSVRGHVLELLVDKSLEMDVEIKINDGGEATIDEEKEEDIFQLDLDDTVGEKKPLEGADVTVNEMADKLDSLMRLLFEYTEASILADPSLTPELYQVFSRVFESLILITHKSKFVQFLLLHLCGLENKALPAVTSMEEAPLTLYRDFAAKLINIIVDPYRATVTRQTGACYLASFVSRASFVCPETVCECICALLRWADAYMQSLGAMQVRANDARDQCNLHSLFYTVCQSACYIMCFRGVEAVKFYRYAAANPGGQHAELEHVDIGPERWNRICGHSLEPLRFCLESVRTEFLQLARIYHLIDPSVLDRLEKSDRRMASVQQQQKKKKPVSRIMTAATLQKQRLSAGVGGLGRGTNPLDSFFPFDPYLLRRSHGFIEPFYNHWGGTIEETFMADDDDGLADDASAQSGDSDSSGNENGSDSDSNDDDDDDDDDDDQSFRNTATGSGINPMSFASNATSASSRSSVLPGGSMDVHSKRDQLQVAWTKTKRERAPSIENGSW